VTVLREIAAAAGPSLAAHAVPEPGPRRFDAGLGERLFVLEAVYEGYLLHYGTPRLFDGMDADLRLLAGDTLYALGLARLAQSGDLPAVAELSDLALGGGAGRGPRRGGGGALGRLGERSGAWRAIGSRPRGGGVPIVPLGTMLALACPAPQNLLYTRG
jgi:hypothetical protein